MLANCIHWGGIQRKQVIAIDNYNSHKFYALRNAKDDYDFAYLELDNHLFPICSIINIDKAKETFKNKNLTEQDLKNDIIKTFENQLREGRVSLGLAEYLNRTDEALQAREKRQKEYQEELEKMKQERIQKELEYQKELEESLKEKVKMFKNGEKIGGRDFVDLCDKYEIKLPLRTRGWALNKLVEINENTYTYNRTDSKVIFKYTKLLKDAIMKEK